MTYVDAPGFAPWRARDLPIGGRVEALPAQMPLDRSGIPAIAHEECPVSGDDTPGTAEAAALAMDSDLVLLSAGRARSC
ncbi:hypothetical protein HNP84_005337 [Thermocatellispora tengchongensis]|uniref:Uncharacterized protein n=1 Tax=Thermocatellispora tengchongensis TaxID=1073253 RepID=A0A840PCE1_9ACTN|nr:hypothetical protein [Thermocatellispora tengchongensis]MBB5135593.1 hypothetical protein [Thermocatellispora tengchongensis]